MVQRVYIMVQCIFKSVYEWLLNLNSADFIAMLALIVSVISFLSSYQINKKANEFSNRANNLTSLVNSAEFELYKKLKYDILSMIAQLKAIDNIAAVAPHVKEKTDYSREINFLRELQASPVYPILLYSIKDDGERLLFETRIRLLTMSNFSSYEFRGWIHQIVKTIEDNLEINEIEKMDFDTLVKDLCTMECMFTAFNLEEWKNRNRSKGKDFQGFTYFLIDKCKVKDPDVLLFFGVLKDDVVIVQKAIDEGANVNVTDQQIIERYQKEYDTFIKE